MANKLELTWYGKDESIKVEPRLLIENTALSNTAFDSDTENMLIHGDNLLALKALEKKFAGQVKCIYIDPPYNTGSAFEHYDDNLEHSQWLNLMRPRLEILWNLLNEDGSIWISIDDDEQAYLKVLCDEVFRRSSFIASIVWQKRTSPDMRAVISDGHDFILVYAKNRERFKITRNKLPLSEDQAQSYKNPDNDPRGPWTSADYTAQGFRPNQMYTITTPGGITFTPPEGKCWKNIESIFLEQVADNRIWFGADGCGMPRRKTFLSEHEGVIPWTWWTNKEVGHNQEAKKEVIALFSAANVFDTPKPERLIERIIHIASNPGDLVLDSFLGSGTTAAVAHKMGRSYIGIEMGDHAYTHCKLRLDKVIAGEDNGGITKSQNWQGGGGYRFYELAPTLINEDAFGEAVINPDYSADALAAAVALHEGFTYQPSADFFWKQAVGNENSYLFTTTRHLTADYLNAIKSSMDEGEYLVIACRSYDKGLDNMYANIAVKKIPQMLLNRCEFGKNDYSLNIVRPPVYEDEEVEDDE
ncbi:MAG: site-specific DNA-methyltransferase [Flavonifractor plautii]|nr:site-specific DNA-methyltransferase [Flavonifractor plautii]MDU6343172.1 site-specific DNA-methyltransferase [Flavonifractor plautii]